MNKAKYKTLLSVTARAIRNRDDHIASLKEQVATWETRFNAEVSRRKCAQVEWEAAQELSERLEGS